MFTLVFAFALALVLSALAFTASLVLVSLVLTALQTFPPQDGDYTWKGAPDLDTVWSDIRWMMHLDEHRRTARTRALIASDTTCEDIGGTCSTDCLSDGPSLTSAQRNALNRGLIREGLSARKMREIVVRGGTMDAWRLVSDLVDYRCPALTGKLIRWTEAVREYHGTVTPNRTCPVA